jgi:hypothetical protein
MAGAFQGDLNETPDFCGDYPFGTLHRRSPSLSCHDDIYEREYGQVHYGIDCHTGRPGKDGNDERDGRQMLRCLRATWRAPELHASPENGCSKAQCWHENVTSKRAPPAQPAGFLFGEAILDCRMKLSAPALLRVANARLLPNVLKLVCAPIESL